MQSVTVALDERVAAWARVRAAELDVSLSRFLRELTQAQMDRTSAYAVAMPEYFAARPVALKRKGRCPRRESLHDRARLR
jgi:hypothetical protein